MAQPTGQVRRVFDGFRFGPPISGRLRFRPPGRVADWVLRVEPRTAILNVPAGKADWRRRVSALQHWLRGTGAGTVNPIAPREPTLFSSLRNGCERAKRAGGAVDRRTVGAM